MLEIILSARYYLCFFLHLNLNKIRGRTVFSNIRINKKIQNVSLSKFNSRILIKTKHLIMLLLPFISVEKASSSTTSSAPVLSGTDPSTSNESTGTQAYNDSLLRRGSIEVFSVRTCADYVVLFLSLSFSPSRPPTHLSYFSLTSLSILPRLRHCSSRWAKSYPSSFLSTEPPTRSRTHVHVRVDTQIDPGQGWSVSYNTMVPNSLRISIQRVGT